jgi:hypothetical protein
MPLAYQFSRTKSTWSDQNRGSVSLASLSRAPATMLVVDTPPPITARSDAATRLKALPPQAHLSFTYYF